MGKMKVVFRAKNFTLTLGPDCTNIFPYRLLLHLRIYLFSGSLAASAQGRHGVLIEHLLQCPYIVDGIATASFLSGSGTL